MEAKNEWYNQQYIAPRNQQLQLDEVKQKEHLDHFNQNQERKAELKSLKERQLRL